MVNPPGPRISSVNPAASAGASSGATAAHSSGRKPTTRFTPPGRGERSGEARDSAHEVLPGPLRLQVELEVTVLGRAEGEDAGLGRHAEHPLRAQSVGGSSLPASSSSSASSLVLCTALSACSGGPYTV